MKKSDFLAKKVKFFFEKKSIFKNEKKFYIVDSHKSKLSKNGQKSLEIPRGGKWFLAKNRFFWPLSKSNEGFLGISSKIWHFGQKSEKKVWKMHVFWQFLTWPKSSWVENRQKLSSAIRKLEKHYFFWKRFKNGGSKVPFQKWRFLGN